ncbi:hypothetical protein C8J56DRAFT_946467 [Mycena floridula]|nr:hypothetical protein C8J56DRAFT_946467 [Mycena floridula]
MANLDSISDQIIAVANQSKPEMDARTLKQVVRLVFESAITGAVGSEIYTARLSRRMMDNINRNIQQEGLNNATGKPIAGPQKLSESTCSNIARMSSSMSGSQKR